MTREIVGIAALIVLGVPLVLAIVVCGVEMYRSSPRFFLAVSLGLAVFIGLAEAMKWGLS